MKPLSILYLEDNPIDVELVRSRLEAEGIAHRLTHSSSVKQFTQALEARHYNIVLLDYSVPGFEELSALKMSREKLPDVPVIIISGTIGEEIAIETLKQGAIDYVLKQRISRLAPAIRRALQETKEHLGRQSAEKALKASEEKYRMLFETSPEAILLCNLEGVILACNPQCSRLMGIPSDKAVGMTFSRAAGSSPHDLSRLQGLLSAVLKGPETKDVEIRVEVDGETRWIHVCPTFLRENRRPYALQLIIREITERKMAEDRIQKDLKEKEVLLKEIHHRVKNNLQIMCSLLHLQSASFREESFRKKCEACRDRIYAMSLVHEHLYLSKNLSSINFRESAQSLVNKLLQSHAVRGRVSVRLEMKDESLPIGISVPLALILNELAANSLEHAFPEGRKGQVRLLLHPAVRNSYEFSVIDDGIGLPNSIDMENSKGFGLHLVSMLVQQINGSVVIARKKGTAFRIRFPSETI